MRILIWSPFVNLGGGIRLLSSLTSALARHPEVDELALALPPGFVEAFAHLSPKLRLLPIAKPALLRWTETPDAETSAVRFSKRAMGRLLHNYNHSVEQDYLHNYAKDYDVIYMFWPHGRPFQAAQKPIVCTYQDTTLIDFPEILGGAGAELEREYAFGWVTQVDQLVVSSQTVRKNLINYFGEQAARATVIYHNILTTRSAASQSLVQFPGLPERYLLYPANLNAQKNHDTLLNAWAYFAEREKMPLVLLGEYTHILRPDWDLRRNRYWLHDHLIGVVRRSGLQYGRDFYALGYVSDEQLEPIIRAAAGIIVASLSEGGGSYPAEEALSNGIPLLCSDIPVMREHLAAHSAEILWFDPLSTSSILSALKLFQSDYAHYFASAQRGISDHRPTWEEIAAQYVEVFKKAILSFPSNR